ncbi:hypothetical protein RCL_jg21804.t1 [Rhizophagus clarus]|uniref:Protein kinase domain-containing protein n=1 Tax=Rhizophagus clarus TaxID=94130 RepID=A0A8H3L4W3_9GLOM|nr:hypothetical protein RCL_jg21804.t1 [Rhizophagus clarus]
MLFNVADSTKVPVFPSSDLPSSDLSIVEQLNTPEKLGDFLKGRLENLDNHINTLIAQENLEEIKGEKPVAGQVRARSPSLTVEDIDERKRLKREKDTVSRGLETNNLSVGSKPKVFFKNQHSHPIFNGRPFGNSGPPITLYSDTFVKFLNDFNNVDQIIPPDFLQWTEQLIIAASDSYIDEETRNTKIRTIFSMKLGTVIIIEYGEGRQKCKKGGSDPTIQGAIYYRDYWLIKSEDVAVYHPSLLPWQVQVNLRIPDQTLRSAIFSSYSTGSNWWNYDLFHLYNSDNNEIRFGRLKMIVMEYINGTSLDQILKDGTIDSLSHQARQAILDNVTAAIQLLHDNKFVFADLRPPNIMINETDQRAMLIDFDWCGIHDLERYPPSMNSKLPWPTGADPGTVLRKEHDTYWLDLLRKSLNLQ